MTGKLVILRIRHHLQVNFFLFYAIACLLLNVYIAGITFANQTYPKYLADFTRDNGIEITEKSIAAGESLENSLQKNVLISDLYSISNPWEEVTAKDIYSQLSDLVPMIRNQKLMEQKYAKLQDRIDQIQNQKEYLHLSCGSYTSDIYDSLFSMLMRLVTLEILLYASGIAIWTAYEDRQAGTEQSIAATKTGRNIQKTGYIASLILVFATWIFIAGGTFLYLCIYCHLDSFLRSSLSTGFHIRFSSVMPIPFVSWIPLTGMHALQIHLLLQFVLACIFHGISYALSLRQNSSLQTLMTLFSSVLLLFLAAYVFVRTDLFALFELSVWNPVMTAYLEYMWFTDMDLYSVIPMQETWICIVWIIITIVMVLTGLKIYFRKDLNA